MRECDNSKILIRSNFLLSICLLIITLQHFATLHHTSPNYNSLHLLKLHFLSFTAHNPLIWLNPSTFPIVLFPLTSLNQTQYGYHIPKLISKVMNHFPALKNLSPFHFTLFFFLFHLSYQPFTSLYLITSTTRFPSLIYRVSQEEWTKLRESVPYVKIYRYNPKHLHPKLNGYGDNCQRSLKL